MTDIEKITLKIQEMQVQHELLKRELDELKAQKTQKVEKISVDVDHIVNKATSECKSIIESLKSQQNKEYNKTNGGLHNAINSAIDKKVNINFVNNLYRNK
jgi:F0F1-type ATP synthase membrane subunit b/b'